MNRNKLIGIVLLSLAASIWGGMFVVVKVVVSLITPIALVWLRYAVALIALGLFCWRQPLNWHIPKHDWWLLIGIGLIGNTLSIVAQETGTWLTTAQLGAVVTSATPTFMLLFAHWLLKERLDWAKIVAVVMATSGVMLIVGLQLTGDHTLLGAGCLIVAALTWALMSVLVKRATATYPPLQVTTIATAVACITLTPVMAVRPKLLTTIPFTTPTVAGSLLYLGLISTALAFVMWNQGLQRLNASSSGLFFLWQPVVGSLLSWGLLGEPLTWGFIVGTGLIGGAIIVQVHFSH
ncbi:DMT family transporter [Lactiplantibacillus fabifermentans]|uniref:EamA domain-containing protein n=2 Tax=Lactiplantibacillus fabifermentans TaxID=483011 RepID=A0A0R2NL28_9LACO|nr:DMT family transporter [Lactiplantibacillus fabifermentans]ETY73615.1 membrane protein [Lactiplantibacillus fabifermentans T30PCM01]KRO26473.1 hypothetical protein DY78_GL000938 [Lactiplantibacillus fabifermentans DSM 21115]